MDNSFGELSALSECPVCLDQKLDNRVLVPCGHSLCLACLENLLSKKTSTCPECKQKFEVSQSPSGFVKDYRKNSLVALLKSVSLNSTNQKKVTPNCCNECGKEAPLFFCELCQTSVCAEDDAIIHKPKVLQSHKRYPLNKPNDEQLNQEKAKEEKRVLVDQWKQASQVVTLQLEAKKKEYQEQVKLFVASFSTQETEVENFFNQLAQNINKYKNDSKTRLKTNRQTQLDQLMQYEEKLNLELATLKSETDFFEASPVSQWAKVEPKIQESLSNLPKFIFPTVNIKDEKFKAPSLDSIQLGTWETSEWTPSEKLNIIIPEKPVSLPLVLPPIAQPEKSQLKFEPIVPAAAVAVEPEKVREEQPRRPFHHDEKNNMNDLIMDELQRRQDISNLVQQIETGDHIIQLEAIVKLRRYLSLENNPPIQDVIDCGAVSKLTALLQVTNEAKIQFEIVWALTNIASGSSEQTYQVINSGAVPLLVNLLTSKSEDVREQAAWALGNIAGDSPSARDMVLDLKAAPALCNLLKSTSKLSLLRNATWALSNFCRGKPGIGEKYAHQMLPTLAKLIFATDAEILTDACWALSYLSDGSNETIQSVIEAGVCRRLVELLLHTSYSVQTPALRTVGNLVTGDDLQTQILINVSVLPCLMALLSSPKKGIRKEALWTLSNITAGNRSQIQAVIDQNLIPRVVSVVKNVKDWDIRKEGLWVLSNATSGSNTQQLNYLVGQGVIGALCSALGEHPDERILTVILEGLLNFLKAEKNQESRLAANELLAIGATATIQELVGRSDLAQKVLDLLK